MSIVITGMPQIMMTRALALKHALRLEVRSGLKVSRKFNAYQIIKEEFGFKGSKQKVLEQLEEWIEHKMQRIHEPEEKPTSIYDVA
jgi:hypothetical protein